MSEREAKHAWEDATNTWESSVNEDEEGNLITSRYNTESIITAIRKRRIQISQRDYAQSSRRIVRDMIRYLYLVIDISCSMREKDAELSPSKTRLDVVLSLVALFIENYFDQNPLSHLGIIVCRNGEAEIVTQLSGNPRMHKTALVQLASVESGTSSNTGGVFSLQNALEVAGRSLGHMPLYGSREIFLILSSLSTSDPGDVLVETLPRLIQSNIRFSCVSLCAELYVCSRIADGTNGMMGVSLDQNHLKDLIMGQCVPPPKTFEKEKYCEFFHLGFPSRETSDVPSLLHDTKRIYAITAYICPRCKAKASDLPTDCEVCGLKLVLAPHLARSFHHLFPVSPFVEVTDEQVTTMLNYDTLPPITSSSASTKKNINIDDSLLLSSSDTPICCYSCLKHLVPNTDKKESQNAVADVNLRFQCPECNNIFCADCDAYLHDTLHNCPGCLCIS